ncbi:HAMP domain-containing histidine kinase [bacterium]|nr:HAMP domain-containing histidine kinase [bacterium]MDY3022123.1 HAMP domain-containing sensor histidine kinase [Oliverpabstia sp.]
MDRKSNQKVRKYLGIYLGFAVLFSVFMYLLANYEMSMHQQQMLTLMANHPELEAEILSVWKKPQNQFTTNVIRSEILEDTARRIEETYGYDLRHPADGTAWRIFWAAGILTGVLLAGAMGYREWREEEKPAGSGKNLQELYESLERFRQGDFEAFPDYDGCSEEWMKLWETVRELGMYFAGLKERLREEENSTKALITDISHQLKTPLASLRMSYELAAGNQLTEVEKEEFQAQEEKEIEKLELLLNELVNLSRLENHMIQIKPVKASLKMTIAGAVSQIYRKAKSKNIEIQVEMDEDLKINHDEKWTVEAIANVLDNSVKYSGENTTVILRVVPLVRNVVIEIEDEGIGIKTEEFSKIYQRFYRGKEAEQMVKEGAGVGLYLTRMILERQGGTISAKRKTEQGTVFKITLPR